MRFLGRLLLVGLLSGCATVGAGGWELERDEAAFTRLCVVEAEPLATQADRDAFVSACVDRWRVSR